MKTTLITLALAVALLSCTKKETPEPTTKPTAPITSGSAIVGTWQYAFDTCKKMVVTADSITSITCSNSVTSAYSVVSDDTVMLYGQKYILKVVGDTLYKVPAPYSNWDSKYYRL